MLVIRGCSRGPKLINLKTFNLRLAFLGRRWVLSGEEQMSRGKRLAAIWGNGDYGRLGLGSLESHWRPAFCSAFGNESLHGIACGGAHTLFLTVEEEVTSDEAQLGPQDAAITVAYSRSPSPAISDLRDRRARDGDYSTSQSRSVSRSVTPRNDRIYRSSQKSPRHSRSLSRSPRDERDYRSDHGSPSPRGNDRSPHDNRTREPSRLPSPRRNGRSPSSSQSYSYFKF